MCFDPVSAAVLSFAVSGAQAVATYAAGVQESKAVHEAAVVDNDNAQKQISLRQMQEADALHQKQQAENLQQAKAESAVALSAASSGVAGVSVDNLIADVQRNGARNRMTAFENTKMAVNQLQQERESATATAKSRINSAPKPSVLSLVAGIGGAALGGYNTYNKAIA